MADHGIDINHLAQTAITALGAGDSRRARSLLEQVTASGHATGSHWFALTIACVQLGDTAAALTAVDKSLEADPNNLRALILKADCLKHKGDLGQSLEVYRYALRLGGTAKDLPEDIRQGLARARGTCDKQEREYRDFLLDHIRAAGLTPASGGARFQQSLDLMLGNKQIYFQQPRRYFYPGLPQIQFYEPEQFDWVAGMEAASGTIRDELLPLMGDPGRFSPYVKSDASHLPVDNRGLEDNDNWSALFLWEYGRLVPENASQFPKTLEALEAVPMPRIPGQAPMALFSKLAPQTRIPPHNGLLNTRLICHLPLVVPENCGALRVGNEQRSWTEGKLLIFDDSIEHEAWNDSDRERIILLFEVWRPEIAPEERELISALLMAAKEFNEQKG
jgi:aspartyl/asparaginyl beta-hydroxylase (cupin superfamily)